MQQKSPNPPQLANLDFNKIIIWDLDAYPRLLSWRIPFPHVKFGIWDLPFGIFLLTVYQFQ